LQNNREYFGRSWTPERLHAYQLAGLRQTMRVVKANSNFYARHLAQFDASFIDELSLESFARLPFTTKDDLRREMLNMVSKPLDECCFFYETTGTTGPATPCPRDYVDTIYNNMAVTSCLETILKRDGRKHFVGVCGPTELHSFGDTLGDVCKNLGLGMAKFWAYSPVIRRRDPLVDDPRGLPADQRPRAADRSELAEGDCGFDAQALLEGVADGTTLIRRRGPPEHFQLDRDLVDAVVRDRDLVAESTTDVLEQHLFEIVALN
jgi:hypothetical protein